MEVAPSTAYKWVSGGLTNITQEMAEELRHVMMEQCHQIIQKRMPLMDETAPRDVLDGILQVQQQQMNLAGVLGNGPSPCDRRRPRPRQAVRHQASILTQT
jgi:hypothetical protein